MPQRFARMTRRIVGTRHATRASALVIAIAVLAACTGSAASRSGSAAATGPVATVAAAAPSTSAAPSPAPTSSPPPAATAAAASQKLPSQTNTAWGRIWDAIPGSFPRYPGSSDGTPLTAASATFDVPADVATVSSWMDSGLEAIGYRTTASGPGEDGSMTLDSVGPGSGCKARTTVAKTGGTTTMTILLGAACPFS